MESEGRPMTLGRMHALEKRQWRCPGAKGSCRYCRPFMPHSTFPVRKRTALIVVKGKDDEDKDFITRIFGNIFGRAALEDRKPFGLQRMSEESMNELYPATTTEFADPLPTDDPEMSLFRPLLARTRLAALPLRLAFDADKDGWSAKAFHAKCDGYGSAVVLAQTEGGALLGAYNPQGWIGGKSNAGLNEERDSNAAFLFTWPDGNSKRPAIKLPKVGGPNLAVLDGASSGLRFGPEGLTIALQAGREKEVKSRLGSYYAKLPDGGRSVFAPSEKTKTNLTSLKVFVAEGGKEEWTLDGIVWKSKAGAPSNE